MGAKQRVFDWDEAARIIKERKPASASAGLQDDLGWTGGTIWDGKPVTESYCYLSSNWATPVLVIDDEEIACWRYADDGCGWDSGTKWPASALAILAEADK
jgi:hypothetical protein